MELMPMKNGFTLSELLIALAILGVIATFTIPKVLQSQQDGKYKAMAKEAMSMIAGAYDAYKYKNGTVPATMAPGALLPYMNYVKLDSTSQIDDIQGSTSAYNCSWDTCVVLHNGAYLYVESDWNTFGQANPTNYIYFMFDPDGKFTSNANGPGKGMYIDLYYNGRVASSSERSAAYTTYENGSPQNFGPATMPDWFSWN